MNRDRLNEYLRSIVVTANDAQYMRSAKEVLVLLDDILSDAKEAIAIAELIEEGKI